MTKMSTLDSDDIFLIETLHKNNKTVQEIMKRLGHDERTVRVALGLETLPPALEKLELDKIAGQFRRAKDYRKASFWFLQYKLYVLGMDNDYLKYDAALKRAEDTWPGWGGFIQDEYGSKNLAGHSINDIWENVEKQWGNLRHKYQQNPEEDMTFESLIGQKGGKTISIDVEEHHMTAVCKIQFTSKSKEPGSGCLVDINGTLGIITTNELLNSAEQCQKAQAIFETLDGTEINLTLNPNIIFMTNQNLQATFVACDFDKENEEHNEIVPLTKLGDVKEECPVYSYFHLNGNEKVAIQQKVKKVVSSNIGFDGVLKKGACGAPLYCEDSLVAVNHGKKETGGYNSASGILAIEKWITETGIQSASVTDVVVVTYRDGEKVKVQWEDYNWYDSVIKYKTETGYKITYSGFNEDGDVPVERIQKIAGSVPPELPPEDSKTDETTLDEMDKDIIKSLMEKDKTAEEIITKVNADVTVVRKFIADVKFAEVVALLKMDNCEKYAEQFRDQGYDSLTVIYGWPAKTEIIQEKLKAAGCRHGAIMKIQKRIFNSRVYYNPSPGNKISSNISHGSKRGSVRLRIINVNPTAMPDEFKPAGPQRNLTEEFRRSDGSSSIRYAGSQLMADNIPPQLTRGVDCHFYLESSSQNRFFKMTVQWG